MVSLFVDEVTIYTKAGDGGNGCVAWRREPFVPRGGPAGGDGGDGGDITAVGDEGLQSLLDFKYRPHWVAKNGGSGRGKNQAGERGLALEMRLPIGTQIFDAETGDLFADITQHGQRILLCKGGNGGFGNSHFATPSRTAPEFAKPGLPGEEKRLRLSLKLMADVGLLGFPNAGKSTLLSAVSAARPKIANYPFTTLVPQLGVVKIDEDRTLVIADIPGVIEGAAQGAGLGVRFLKHLERVRVLCHLIEIPLEHDDSTILLKKYQILRRELEEFSPELAAIPEIVAINKLDLIGLLDDSVDTTSHVMKMPMVKKLMKHLEKQKIPVMFIGTHQKYGLVGLLESLWTMTYNNHRTLDKKPRFDPFQLR